MMSVWEKPIIYAFLAIRTWLHLFIKPSLIALPCLDKNMTKKVYNFHKANTLYPVKNKFLYVYTVHKTK